MSKSPPRRRINSYEGELPKEDIVTKYHLILIVVILILIALIVRLGGVSAAEGDLLQARINHVERNLVYANMEIQAFNGESWVVVWTPWESSSASVHWVTDMPIQTLQIDESYQQYKVILGCNYNGPIAGCKYNDVYFSVNDSNNLVANPCFVGADGNKPHFWNDDHGVIGLSDKRSNPVCEGMNRSARFGDPQAGPGYHSISQIVNVDVIPDPVPTPTPRWTRYSPLITRGE